MYLYGLYLYISWVQRFSCGEGISMYGGTYELEIFKENLK